MQKANLEKIKLARNLLLERVGVVLFVAGIIFMIVLINVSRSLDDNNPVLLKTTAKSYYLTVANTPELQEKGLGGTQTLAAVSGMLFPYSNEGERCFWMKNMEYPIDIIWVNDRKLVEHIEKNVAPHTYPNIFCHDGKYVIELGAGEAEKSKIRTGQRLEFAY